MLRGALISQKEGEMLPEEHEKSLEDVSEVIVSVDGGVGVVSNVPKQLHPDDRIDEEEHHHQHHHVWKSLAIK